MIYTYPDAEAKPAAPKLPAAGGQPPPEPTFFVGPEPTFLVGPEDSQQPGEGYPLKVVAEEEAADVTQLVICVKAIPAAGKASAVPTSAPPSELELKGPSAAAIAACQASDDEGFRSEREHRIAEAKDKARTT